MGDKPASSLKPEPRGIEIREAHFPGRAPLDAYGNGGFRFADMSHRGSILCLPSGIYGWNVETVGDLTTTAFSQVLKEAAEIEILLVGTGATMEPPGAELRRTLISAIPGTDIMSTGAAVRTFNVLLAEGRAVAAALLAV